MADLFAPACSITTTQRRRFFWAAWWTAGPRRTPFQKPDASGGGLATFEGAIAAAEKAAGRPLVVLEPEWARAFMRTLRGNPPWPTVLPRPKAAAAKPGGSPAGASIWERLGVAPDATAAEIRAAFRKRAKDGHPDQGGDPAAFRLLLAAYDEALRRAARPRRKRPAETA